MDQCAYDSRYNASDINVGEMPSVDTKGTAQEDEDGPRYVMASTPLSSTEDSMVANVASER